MKFLVAALVMASSIANATSSEKKPIPSPEFSFACKIEVSDQKLGAKLNKQFSLSRHASGFAETDYSRNEWESNKAVTEKMRTIADNTSFWVGAPVQSPVGVWELQVYVSQELKVSGRTVVSFSKAITTLDAKVFGVAAVLSLENTKDSVTVDARCTLASE